jgi:predicted phosphodiesterase
MASSTVPTRVMVVSDTHEHCFDGTLMPEVDILIHTGDLTNYGQHASLRECVRMMGTIDAELRLVIAGNHDLSLDTVRLIENMDEEQYAGYHKSALEIMNGPLAKENGVTYLEEGTHTFTLKSGATFKVYASPYTRGNGDWAFCYRRLEDPFNEHDGSDRPLPKNPIPAGVHIVMTHGAPYSVLDQVDCRNLGCPKLLRALGRVRPLMHCFGHIHEGYGAHIVTWTGDGKVTEPEKASPTATEQINEYPYTNEWPIKPGEQTLMVNASTMKKTSRGHKPINKPFVVILDLPRGEP